VRQRQAGTPRSSSSTASRPAARQSSSWEC
jgi:hypothetical protein